MPRELKLNNKAEDVTKLGRSFLVAAGKGGTANAPTDIDLAIRMADDDAEVRGFGQPITPGLVRDIALEYIKKSNLAWKLISDIEDGTITDINEVKASDGFASLISLLHPERQIVSGVFGKEAILQTIALKDCEGIRYIIGEMQGKMTVVLLGVRDVSKKGNLMATSEPLAGWKHYQTGDINAEIPPDIEVHKSSLTRAELFKAIDKQNLDHNKESIVQVLFGEY